MPYARQADARALDVPRDIPGPVKALEAEYPSDVAGEAHEMAGGSLTRRADGRRRYVSSSGQESIFCPLCFYRLPFFILLAAFARLSWNMTAVAYCLLPSAFCLLRPGAAQPLL